MRAHSVRQPWAEVILQGNKTIEVRSGSTSNLGIRLACRIDRAVAREAPDG
jgi:hypothetical protein